MAITERQGITGTLTILLRDRQGRVVERRKVRNVITMAGKHLLANYFTGVMQAVPKLSIAVGKDDKTAEESNTRLGELLEEASASTVVKDNIATVTATLPAKDSESVQELREAGIHILVPGLGAPVLYNRVTFPVVSKGANMEMTLTWEIVF